MTHSAETTQLELLAAADQRLVRTVDGLADPAFARASLLPHWSVSHVLAHVALNGEALAGALRGVTSGTRRPMYESQAVRDRDIAELGAAPADEIRARVRASTTLFDREVSLVPHDRWEVTIERTPGKPAFRARSTVLMRLREVEIHHADLGLDYSHRDWVPAFSEQVIESAVRRSDDWPVPFRVLVRDLGRTWELGDGEPVCTVSGESHDVAWWLTGRDDHGTLTVDHDELPEVPAW